MMPHDLESQRASLAEAESVLADLVKSFGGVDLLTVTPDDPAVDLGTGRCDMCGAIVWLADRNAAELHLIWHKRLTTAIRVAGVVATTAARRGPRTSGVLVKLRCESDGCERNGTEWEVELPTVDEGLVGTYAADVRCDGCLCEPRRV